MTDVSPRTIDFPYVAPAAAPVETALREAVALIRAARRVLVVSHEKPDGDAIGATLATTLVIEALGVEAVPFNVDVVPPNLRFLPGAAKIVRSLRDDDTFDLTVLVDCSQRSRPGAAFPARGWAPRVVCIDHHATLPSDPIDVFVHDVTAAATGDLIFRLAGAAGVPLTPELATCIFVTLHTDTGSFRYDCTRPETMEIAGAVLKTGISVWDIASELYETQSPERLRLLGEALRTLQVHAGGRLATIVVADDVIRAVGADESDTDGIVNHARSVRGVQIAAQLSGSDERGWRVSLRSRGALNVAAVAETFGGGGHHNAAGCTLRMPLADARQALESALVALFDRD